MKFLALIVASLVSVSAHAHRFERIEEMSNSQAQAVLKASDAINAKKPRFTASVAYKVTQIKPAQKAGESESHFYVRILKSALHRDYPITGDDGGYDFGQLSAANARRTIEDDIRDYYIADDLSDELIVALDQAAQDDSLIVVTGSGSGNNTFAYIAAVIDPARNEIVVFISSNFGSDS
jgi:hypothetical protein